jgi:predicted metal-dependent hydrolase
MLALFKSGRKSADPLHIEVPHGEAVYQVALRRKTGARRFTLRVSSATGQIVLTLPPRGSLLQATDFARRQGGWIAARLAKQPDKITCTANASIPFRGIAHLIEHRTGVRGIAWTESDPATGINRLVIAGQAEHVHRRVLDYLKKEARKALSEAAFRYAAALNVKITGITLRDTTSRWGSCSSRGTLNFSWRLILAPAFVLDYLAAHEVAHLRELNHSHRFWTILKEICPETDAAEAWLKRNGATLHRYN